MFKNFKKEKLQSRDKSGFWMSLIVNLLLNFELLVVAVGLLILHFVLDIPAFLFWIALLLWFVPNLLKTILLFVLVGMGNSVDEYRENKNPYSKGNNQQNSDE